MGYHWGTWWRNYMTETITKPQQNAPGNPNAADAAVKHGLNRMLPLLERGLSVIPEDSPLHPIVCERRNQIATDAGGKDNLSQLQNDLIETYVTTMVLLSSVDSYLINLERPGLSKTGRQLKPLGIVNRRNHKLRAIVEQRNKLVKTCLDLAQAIGLKRQSGARDITAGLAEAAAAANQESQSPTPITEKENQ